jgi:hypothetical protein
MLMTIRARAASIAGPIHDRLIGYVAAAVAAGLLLPSVANRLSGGVPLPQAAAQPVAADAPAINRLAAFLGRSLGGDAEPASA